jgi:hypothetical protein
MQSNRREHVRLTLPVPLTGLLEVTELNGKIVSSIPSKISIFDISSGGVRLHTRINFPMNMEIRMKLSFTLLGQNLDPIAFFNRKKQIREDLFEYGIAFLPDPAEQRMLISHINTLAIRLRKTLTNNLITSSSSPGGQIKQMYSYTP